MVSDWSANAKYRIRHGRQCLSMDCNLSRRHHWMVWAKLSQYEITPCLISSPRTVTMSLSHLYLVELIHPFESVSLLKYFPGLYYMNAYGHEVYPSPNPEYISRISSADVLVYSCGSLWTRYYIVFVCFRCLIKFYSIMPCLALKGVAQAIAHSPSLRAKVLLCNLSSIRLRHSAYLNVVSKLSE
jgi:hypothetical protein